MWCLHLCVCQSVTFFSPFASANRGGGGWGGEGGEDREGVAERPEEILGDITLACVASCLCAVCSAAWGRGGGRGGGTT